MYAQVITFDEDPAAVQHGIDHVLADVVPALEESDGAKGLWLVDREHGKRISIMVWESEEAAQAAFARIAARAAANPGERPKPVSVERFEIYAQV
jgi:heme-degrading monooxygenase HmoA